MFLEGSDSQTFYLGVPPTKALVQTHCIKKLFNSSNSKEKIFEMWTLKTNIFYSNSFYCYSTFRKLIKPLIFLLWTVFFCWNYANVPTVASIKFIFGLRHTDTQNEAGLTALVCVAVNESEWHIFTAKAWREGGALPLPPPTAAAASCSPCCTHTVLPPGLSETVGLPHHSGRSEVFPQHRWIGTGRSNSNNNWLLWE